MANTTETYEAKINLDLQESNAALRDFTQNLDLMFRTVSTAGVELETPFKKSLDSTAKLKGDIDAILDQFKVFGLVGNNAAAALEQIADPIKRAEAATQLLTSAMKAATSAEADLAAKASVAAAKFEIQTGSTKSLLESLQKMNPGLAASVGHINSIGDAQKRSSAAAALFAKSQAPVGKIEGAFASLGDSVNAAKAKMASLPPLMQTAIVGAAGAAVGAVLALAAAVGTTLVDAWKAWAAQSKEALEAQEDLDASTNRLQVSLGKLVENLGEVSDTQAGAGKIADDTAGVLDRLNTFLESPGGEDYAKGLSQMNQQFSDMTPMMGWFLGALHDGKDALTELGEEQKQANALLQASNPLLIEQAALMDQIAASSLQAGTGLEGVEAALKETAVEAWKLERALDELDKKWDNTASLDSFADSTQNAASEALRLGKNLDELDKKWSDTTSLDDFGESMRNAATDALSLNKALEELEKKWKEGSFDAQNAEGALSDTGGGLLADLDKRAKEGEAARKKRKEDYYKSWKKEMEDRKKVEEQRAKDILAIEKMNADFEQATVRSGEGDELTNKYADDPTIQRVEAAAKKMREEVAKGKQVELITAEEIGGLKTADDKLQAISGSMNDAAKGAILLGASMAGMAIETLVAGDSMKKFGWQALQAFGSFASQAGQVILATGIGQLALFEGNPGGAIAAGLGLIALGSVLGGIAKKNMKQGGSKASGVNTKQLVDSFRDRNKKDDEGSKEVVIYAQFGTERLEGFVANAVMSGQRNGRYGMAGVGR